MYAVMDGERIRAMREACDLSRRQLAKEAGVSPSILRSVVSGCAPLRVGGLRVSLSCIRGR